MANGLCLTGSLTASHQPLTILREKAMVVNIFGRPDCGKCQTTKNKVSHFLSKWGLDEKVSITFHDMSTVDGMAEGSFHDVIDIPATILFDGERRIARWDGKVPESEELRTHLQVAAR